MEYTKIAGIILILIGLSGFLFMNGRISGYVVSEDNNQKYKLINEFLEVKGIKNIKSSLGRKKTMEIEVKNIGNIILKDCKIIGNGEVGSWIFPSQTLTIVQTERAYLSYDLIVPENVKPNIYKVEIEINCEESSISESINITILEGIKTLIIKEIDVDNFELNLTYIFDNTNYIGEKISVDIWIINSDGFETYRLTDSFSINKDTLIKRNILIKLLFFNKIFFITFFFAGIGIFFINFNHALFFMSENEINTYPNDN